ncbi:MAG: GspE/PulE family protein [Janthinobacterium lividum]
MTVVLPAGGTKRKELGHLLVEQGLLKEQQLTLALTFQKQTGKPLGEVLVELGLVETEDITRARALQVDAAYVMMDDVAVDKAALALVPAAVAHQYSLLPIGRTADGTLKIIVAAWNARVMEAAHKIATANRLRIAPAIATEAPLLAAIAHWYGPAPESKSEARDTAETAPRSAVPAKVPPPAPVIAQNATAMAARVDEKRASDVFSGAISSTLTSSLSNGQPDALDTPGVDQPAVIQFINKILTDAILSGASDIHLEPRRNSLEIRFRQDGTLRHVDSIRREFQPACSSRLKIMAEMNIAERRLPQDGRISVTVEGRSVDMRVSSLPTQYGESLVLRILDKSGVRPHLSQLGFSDRNLQALQSLIRKPHGIFLATGPTGSGKTTTLYSAIHEIHTPDVNIITVEDPIEYELDGIRQSNVNEKAGLTFARQLRAILRQDPDIIYVGEIRDQETAEIAFRAALTGHLVFSTLHCNDAAGAITRLLNMGMDPFLVASSVVGILAQRLVRKVCPQCAKPSMPSEVDLQAFGVDTDSPAFHQAKFMAGAGCEACSGIGYKGRYSVQELMVMDDGIRAMTLNRLPSHKIRQAAMARGMTTMRQDAAAKVMQGITTFEEAQKRVYIEESSEE